MVFTAELNQFARIASLLAVAGWLTACGEPGRSDTPESADSTAQVETAFRDVEMPPSEFSSVHLPHTPEERAANRSWQQNRLANYQDMLRELDGGRHRADRIEPSILKGHATSDYDAVGYVINTQHDRGICTGTLISCNALLTANHCFEQEGIPDDNADHFRAFFQHAGLVGIERMHRFCNDADDCDPDVKDLAIAILDRTPRIAPYPLAQENDWTNGDPAFIVGFGVSGTGSDRGLKRVGAVSPLDCPDPDNCFELVEAHSNCTADSGGPLLVQNGIAYKVLGVAKSGGVCDEAKGRYLSMLHDDYAQWAKSIVEQNACTSGVLQSVSALPGSLQVEDELVNVAIQSGAQNIQANLNFELGYGNELTLAAPSDATCEAIGEAVSCKLPGPYAGDENILVEREDSLSGKAFYQLTIVPQ